MAELPGFYRAFLSRYPEVGGAYTDLSRACKAAGPLDERTAELVKIGISVGAAMEGATRSHVRKALAAGATREEIEHALLMATTTLGFPAMMRGRAWMLSVFEEQDDD